MHMKVLPIFTNNLLMGCLYPDTSCQLLCPVINIAGATISNTLKCTLHNFFGNKTRFSLASTVTRLRSCSGKKYTYASRAPCFYTEINIFKHF